MVWFPLHCHSHFSLLDGLSKPEQIADRLVECGYAGSALTDHGTVSGCPGFSDALNSVCKGCRKQKAVCRCPKYEAAKLKSVLGCEFYICQDDASLRTPDNMTLAHLCVLAKNLDGWKNLVRASSASYRPEFSYRKPRLDLKRLAEFGKGQFITFSGHMGSDLANAIFLEPKLAYRAQSEAEAKCKTMTRGWQERATAVIQRYQALFGRENFYVEIQLVDHKNLPASIVVAEGLRWLAKKLGVPTVATADSHYCRREDVNLQRLILCIALDTKMDVVRRQVEAGEDVALGTFFASNSYHIPSPEEMRDLHSDHPEELAHSIEIASRCQVYKVTNDNPLLPNFDCPAGMSPDDYLASLAKKGWARVSKKVPKELWPTYESRLWEKEFPVIKGANLSSYFLIVQDIIRHAVDDLKTKTGKGRGSGAGCLLSYLTNITRVDPIRYGLIFERFYNAGRNSPGRIALPDIDSDFCVSVREQVIDYLRKKYGRDHVCQMGTFQRMQGRGALSDVFRAWGKLSFDEVKRITEFIPDESEIMDKLQEMREETGEASIIEWALQNHAEQLSEWATMKEDGTIEGPLAKHFMEAICLEGTKRGMGKHASGVIICSEPLQDIVPMVWDKKSEEMMVGVDMRDAEKMGLVKFDILGLRTLDCIMDAESFARCGRPRPI
jgi:DNA polymerase-3 subunit alpha